MTLIVSRYGILQALAVRGIPLVRQLVEQGILRLAVRSISKAMPDNQYL